MDRDHPSWPHHPLNLICEVGEMFQELGIACAVTHITVAIGIAVETQERRRENTEVHGLGG